MRWIAFFISTAAGKEVENVSEGPISREDFAELLADEISRRLAEQKEPE